MGVMKVSSRKMVSGVIRVSVFRCLWVWVVCSLCLSCCGLGLVRGMVVVEWVVMVVMFWVFGGSGV